MPDKENFSKRLKKAMVDAEMNQVELGKALGISQSQVNYWVTARRMPTLESIQKIANLLDKPLDYFIKNEHESVNDFLKRTGSKVDLIPVLGTSSATNEKFILEETESFIPFPKSGEHQFAIRVEGDCMEDPKDPQNSIFNGNYVIVDPDVTPTNGDVVLARISSEYSTIKRMYIKEDCVELIPDNPKCKPLIKKKLDIEIVGKVVNVYRPVKKKRRRTA